jgi:zinc protease
MRFLASVLAFVLVVAAVPKPPPNSSADVLKATLANGLRVTIAPNSLAPVVSTQMTYLVGSRDDLPAFPGLAHAQEHMMYRGTKDLSTDQLSTIGTALGGSFNAFTRPTVTSYQYTVPADTLDAILRIESDRMRDVLDAQSEWADERGAIEQEVAGDEGVPGADFFRDANAMAFKGTPYGHDGVGSRKSFDALTGPVLKRFHQTWYHPNNAVLTIAGDVDPQRTLAMVRARFEAIPREAVPEHKHAPLPAIKRTVINRPTTLTYPLAALVYRFPGVRDPDFIASYLLQATLNSERGELKAIAAKGEALFTDVQSGDLLPEAQLVYVTAGLRPNDDPVAFAGRLEALMRRYAEKGVPAEIFEAAKRRSIADQEQSRNSITELASDWSDVIAVDGEPSIAHEQELLGRVTLADVNRVAKKYFDPARVIIGELTPSANGSSEAPNNERSKESPVSDRPVTTKLPAWAQPLLTNVSSTTATTHPSDETLPNGIRLIVQPETISNSVLIFGNVQTNPSIQEPLGKEGLSIALDGVFAYGSMSHDRDGFQKQLDDIGAEVAGGTHFAAQATADHFDRTVDLLAENVLTPRLDAETFATSRDLAVQQVATSQGGSHTIAQKMLEEKLLPAGDPALRVPDPRTMRGFSLSDARDYYAKIFRPDITTITVVGNVTQAQARAAIERAFGKWTASGPKPDLTLPAIPQNAPANVAISPPGLRQSLVTLAETVQLSPDSQDFYALDLANTILGGGNGGAQQTRFFRDLRQNRGLVYYVGSRLAVGTTRGRFEVTYGCAPQNLKTVEDLVTADIAKLAREAPSPFELGLNKASLVRRIAVGGADSRSIAQSLLALAQAKRPLDQPAQSAAKYRAVSADAVSAATAKYLRPQGFVRLLEGPQ